MRTPSGLAALAALTCPVIAAALPATAGAATNGPIVFQGGQGDHAQIFTIEPDGTALRRLTDAGGRGAENPAWSPDGTTVAYDVSTETRADIFTVRSDGSGRTRLRPGASRNHANPAFSPDGSQISFDEDSGPGQPAVHGIFVAAAADGTRARRLTTALSGDDAYDTESAWSPDGTRIAFTRVKNSRKAAIFTVRTDGSGLRRLTPWALDAASPDWSPDGTRIAFNSYWDPHPGKSANIFTVNADGSGRTAVTRHRGGRTHSFRPSWSPDGTKLVIARFVPRGAQGRLDLFVIDPDGSGARRLTRRGVTFAATPDWAPAAPAPAS